MLKYTASWATSANAKWKADAHLDFCKHLQRAILVYTYTLEKNTSFMMKYVSYNKAVNDILQISSHFEASSRYRRRTDLVITNYVWGLELTSAGKMPIHLPSDLIVIANCIWQLHMQLHIHILVHCTGKCRSLACTCTYQYECTCTCRSLSWYALVKNQPDDLFIVFSSDDGGARGQAFKDPDRGALSCGQLVILQRDAAGVYKVSSPVQQGKSVFQYLNSFYI